MEVKNLFDPAVKQEIIDRIHQLDTNTPARWGRMNAAQMLAHVQLPIAIAYGTHRPKGSFLLRVIGPLFKGKLWDQKPYKHGLPTDPTFVMTGLSKEFESEKQKLVEMVNRFTEMNIAVEKHPVFGKMTKENWGKAIWKHLDHHLQQFGV